LEYLMRTTFLAALAAGALAVGGTLATLPSVQAQSASDALAALKAGELATSYAKSHKDGRRVRVQNYSRDYGRSYSSRTPTRYYRRDRGDSAAAGIAGFAAGAILGGALAQQQYQAAPVYVVPNQSAVAYCSQRFRSYDPRSGTYLGYDGLRHRCP
jgi:hypothetical protein